MNNLKNEKVAGVDGARTELIERRGEGTLKCLQIQCHRARIRGIVFDSLAKASMQPLYRNKGVCIEYVKLKTKYVREGSLSCAQKHSRTLNYITVISMY